MPSSERSWLPPPPGYPLGPVRQVKRRRYAEPAVTVLVDGARFVHPVLRVTRRWADPEYDECVTARPRALCRCGANRLEWSH